MDGTDGNEGKHYNLLLSSESTPTILATSRASACVGIHPSPLPPSHPRLGPPNQYYSIITKLWWIKRPLLQRSPTPPSSSMAKHGTRVPSPTLRMEPRVCQHGCQNIPTARVCCMMMGTFTSRVSDTPTMLHHGKP